MVTATAGFVSYQWYINGVLSPATGNVLIDYPPVNMHNELLCYSYR